MRWSGCPGGRPPLRPSGLAGTIAAGEKGGIGMGIGMGMGTGVGMGMESAMARPVALGSARDRARLRERVVAERARVERVLARGPLEVERRREERADSRRDARSIAPMPARTAAAPAIRARLDAATMRATACGLCGGRDVVEDEVGGGRGGGRILLGRCRRCDYRWTERWTESWTERRTDRSAERSTEPVAARFVPWVRRPESPGAGVRQAGSVGGPVSEPAPGAPVGA